MEGGMVGDDSWRFGGDNRWGRLLEGNSPRFGTADNNLIGKEVYLQNKLRFGYKVGGRRKFILASTSSDYETAIRINNHTIKILKQ